MEYHEPVDEPKSSTSQYPPQTSKFPFPMQPHSSTYSQSENQPPSYMNYTSHPPQCQPYPNYSNYSHYSSLHRYSTPISRSYDVSPDMYFQQNYAIGSERHISPQHYPMNYSRHTQFRPVNDGVEYRMNGDGVFRDEREEMKRNEYFEYSNMSERPRSVTMSQTDIYNTRPIHSSDRRTNESHLAPSPIQCTYDGGNQITNTKTNAEFNPIKREEIKENKEENVEMKEEEAKAKEIVRMTEAYQGKMEFSTIEEAYKTLSEWAGKNNVTLRKGSGNNKTTKDGTKKKVVFVCECSGKYRSCMYSPRKIPQISSSVEEMGDKRKLRKRKSKKTECPFRINLNYRVKDGMWCITKMILQHNHM